MATTTATNPTVNATQAPSVSLTVMGVLTVLILFYYCYKTLCEWYHEFHACCKRIASKKDKIHSAAALDDSSRKSRQHIHDHHQDEKDTTDSEPLDSNCTMERLSTALGSGDDREANVPRTVTSQDTPEATSARSSRRNIVNSNDFVVENDDNDLSTTRTSSSEGMLNGLFQNLESRFCDIMATHMQQQYGGLFPSLLRQKEHRKMTMLQTKGGTLRLNSLADATMAASILADPNRTIHLPSRLEVDVRYLQDATVQQVLRKLRHYASFACPNQQPTTLALHSPTPFHWSADKNMVELLLTCLFNIGSLELRNLWLQNESFVEVLTSNQKGHLSALKVDSCCQFTQTKEETVTCVVDLLDFLLCNDAFQKTIAPRLQSIVWKKNMATTASASLEQHANQQIGNHSNLRVLSCGNNITSKGAARALARILQTPGCSVERLELGSCSLGAAEEVTQALRYNTSLKKLSFTTMQHEEGAMEAPIPQLLCDVLLSDNLTLEECHLPQPWGANNQIYHDRAQFYLYLNRVVGRQRLFQGDVSSTTDWFDAIIDHQDDLSVLYYLIQHHPSFLLPPTVRY